MAIIRAIRSAARSSRRATKTGLRIVGHILYTGGRAIANINELGLSERQFNQMSVRQRKQVVQRYRDNKARERTSNAKNRRRAREKERFEQSTGAGRRRYRGAVRYRYSYGTHWLFIRMNYPSTEVKVFWYEIMERELNSGLVRGYINSRVPIITGELVTSYDVENTGAAIRVTFEADYAREVVYKRPRQGLRTIQQLLTRFPRSGAYIAARKRANRAVLVRYTRRRNRLREIIQQIIATGGRPPEILLDQHARADAVVRAFRRVV